MAKLQQSTSSKTPFAEQLAQRCKPYFDTMVHDATLNAKEKFDRMSNSLLSPLADLFKQMQQASAVDKSKMPKVEDIKTSEDKLQKHLSNIEKLQILTLRQIGKVISGLADASHASTPTQASPVVTPTLQDSKRNEIESERKGRRELLDSKYPIIWGIVNLLKSYKDLFIKTSKGIFNRSWNQVRGAVTQGFKSIFRSNLQILQGIQQLPAAIAKGNNGFIKDLLIGVGVLIALNFDRFKNFIQPAWSWAKQKWNSISSMFKSGKDRFFDSDVDAQLKTANTKSKSGLMSLMDIVEDSRYESLDPKVKREIELSFGKAAVNKKSLARKLRAEADDRNLSNVVGWLDTPLNGVVSTKGGSGFHSGAQGGGARGDFGFYDWDNGGGARGETSTTPKVPDFMQSNTPNPLPSDYTIPLSMPDSSSSMSQSPKLPPQATAIVQTTNIRHEIHNSQNEFQG